MELQTNPYLIWELFPGLVLFGIGLYIQSRPIKKRESNAFSLLMFGGSLWAFANAIQYITPNVGWQKFWNAVAYIGIMAIPTAWFLLSVKLTGFLRERIERVEKYFWIPPALLYLSLVTTDFHKLFVTSFTVTHAGGYIALENSYGVLFYVHTAYSYILLVVGILFLAFSLVTRFKKYGIQAYGLIIGVLAPLLGNAYFVFGSPPSGFPDPTPIIFTITGLAFAWAIFGGHILEVVPLAHDVIVRKLSTGVVILDADKNIREINDAARSMLGLNLKTRVGDSLKALLEQNRDIASAVNDALNNSADEEKNFQIIPLSTRHALDVHISHISDATGNATGWLIQLNDVSEKKKAEENLASTQRVMKSVLDTLQDSFFEINKDGRIVNANRAMARKLGFARQEDMQEQFLVSFTDEKNIREIFSRVEVQSGLLQPLEPFEYNYRTKDGGTFVGETAVSPIFNGSQVIGVRGLIRDVTARVNAEKEILKQKNLLDSLLQQSPLPIVINDMEKRITVVNPAFEKLFGYSQEEAVGKSLDKLLSALQMGDGENELSTLIMRKQEIYESRRRKKDGTLVDVEIFTTPFFVGGERFGYLAFYNDISDRLKTQANLEKTQSSYFAVLESLQDPYFEIARTGNFVYVNQALCNWTGYSKGELLGRHFRVVASRKSVRETALKHEAMFRDGKPIPPFDFIYRRKDGQEFPGEIVVSPIFEGGDVIGGRGIIRDISARIKAEDVLRDAKESAEAHARELAAINRVAATVSQSLDLKEILQSVCSELTSIFEIRNAGIGLLTADKRNLEIVAFHTKDPNETSVLGVFLPIEGNTSSMEVLKTKKTVVIQDAQNDPRTSSISDLSRKRGTKSIMIVPLLSRGDAIGTIGMPAKDVDHVFTENEIQLAETIASQIATAVDNARLHTQTESALGAAERDLEIGRQIQSGFFPEKLPSIPGWEIAAHFHAARQVAGDFYDVFKFKNSNFVAFIIADVCDKGVGAALFMVLFRSLLRAFSETHIAKENVRERLLSIIVNTNNFIAEYHGKSNMFATLFFGVLDPESGTLHYVNGGHEPPVILKQNGEIVQRLLPTGPAVGMFKDLEFHVEQVKFNEGDSLIGFTDGVTDAKNISGGQFSEERLLKTIAVPWTSTFSMLFELNIELQKHIGAQSQFDDITLLSIRRKGVIDTLQHAICRTAHMNVLEELRDFVESAAAFSGLPHEDVFAFKLAADEICTNVIQYGFRGREPGLLSLSFSMQKDVAQLVIRDDGKYFSPEQAKNPDIEADWSEREIGGLGIYFVKELMDNVTYNRADGDFNQFVLEKKIGN